jgi:hypothetical protein
VRGNEKNSVSRGRRGIVALFLGTFMANCAHSEEKVVVHSFRSYVETLRRDMSQGKVQTLTDVLKLTESDAEVFWPIYHDFETELFTLGDCRFEILRTFAEA